MIKKSILYAVLGVFESLWRDSRVVKGGGL